MMFQQLLGNPMENRPFNIQLRCYSAAMFSQGNEKKVKEIENGGKILLPPSCLDWLTRLHIAYPMLFKITNPKPDCQRVTHCGVLEFLAEEGKCHLPYWMMKLLLLEEGGMVTIDYVNLPIATYAKFKPQSTDFLEITNPKVVLEMKLRNFACLTKNDLIALEYCGRIYEILVKDVKPGNAVSIVECDMNVEFDAPEGYVEPTKQKKEEKKEEEHDVIIRDMAPAASTSGFVPFSGAGCRLDGKNMSSQQKANKPLAPAAMQRFDLKDNRRDRRGQTTGLVGTRQHEHQANMCFAFYSSCLNASKRG